MDAYNHYYAERTTQELGALKSDDWIEKDNLTVSGEIVVQSSYQGVTETSECKLVGFCKRPVVVLSQNQFEFTSPLQQ